MAARSYDEVVDEFDRRRYAANPLANGAATDDWPDATPIQTELRPVPAFDAATLLPPVLRNWVADEAKRMQCPQDFIAAGALVALGSIIGARVVIKPKSLDSWAIVPNLWGGVVGSPSAQKTPAITAALKPLDALIANAAKAQCAEQEEFEHQQRLFLARGTGIDSRMKAAAKKKNPDGAELAAIADEQRVLNQRAPKAPTQRRYKTNDATVEKLGELLRDNPAGVLVLRDELVGLLASWDREGHEGDRAFYLEGWNGNNSFNTDRIGRGNIAIPNHCVSVFGGIVSDKLTAYLEMASNALANDGTLQRFQLLVYPNPGKWTYQDRAPDAEARTAVFRMFATLADMDPVAWGAALPDEHNKFPSFRFDERAQALFIEWTTELHRERLPREDQPLIAQHLTKFDKLFPALALILHLVDCAATGQRGRVTEGAALMAAGWCEYLEAHARRCYGLLADAGFRAAQALADAVRKGKLVDGFTARDVRRNQWRNLTTNEAVLAGIDWLETEGWLRVEERDDKGLGRRTKRYRINPKVIARADHDQLA